MQFCDLGNNLKLYKNIPDCQMPTFMKTNTLFSHPFVVCTICQDLLPKVVYASQPNLKQINVNLLNLLNNMIYGQPQV